MKKKYPKNIFPSTMLMKNRNNESREGLLFDMAK
jgi:hypothetical protein